MSRARIEALAMVNWRGIFYERFLFDRAVTALEGTNGAGKTTVMVAAYVALLPDLPKLRFTNLGEHDGRSGDRGIYGRLGESAWPAFTVLDLRVGRDERVLAGVRITRKTEPSVELDPFVVTGLSPDVRLRDVLLDTDGGQDRLLDRPTLNQKVALAGGEITWCTATQYFKELFDRGILPLRLASDEDRKRFNHMLRTSMIGGISHTLSGGLRDFVLREDPSLAEGLRSMRDNLSACQSTRRQIEEEERAEAEVRGVYEAGATMFAAGVHQHRLQAETRQADRARAERTAGAAAEALQAAEAERTTAQATLRGLDAEAARAIETVEQARQDEARVVEALALVERLGEARVEEADRAGRAEAALITLRGAEDALRVATEGAERARRQLGERTHELSNQGEAFARLSERAGLYRNAILRRQEVAVIASLPEGADPHERAERYATTAHSLVAEVAAFTSRIAAIDGELRDAVHHAEAHARLVAALAEAESALGSEGGSPYERAERLLAALPGWRALAARVEALTAEAQRLAREVTRQARAREEVARVLGREATGADVQAAWTAAEEATREAARAQGEAAHAELDLGRKVAEAADAKRAAEREIPAWDGVAALARALARDAGVPLGSLDALGAAEDAWRGAEDRARRAFEERRSSAEARRAEALALEQRAAGLDPRIVEVAGEVGGEPLAARYDAVPLEEAGRVEALLGPLRDAIVVAEPARAARAAALRPDRPPDLHFVREAPEDGPHGEVLDGAVVVSHGEHVRLTTIPERPAFGAAARRARIDALRADAEAADAEARAAEQEVARHAGWLADARRLRGEAARWLSPDPRRALQEVGERLAGLELARAAAAEARARAAADHRADEARRAALAAILPSAALLDDIDLGARAAARAAEAREAARLRTALAAVSGALARLGAGIEALRRAPLSEAERRARAADLAEARAARTRHASGAEAAAWLAEHAEALDWGREAEEERSAQEKLAGLRAEHRLAEEALKAAEAREAQEKGNEAAARAAFLEARSAADDATRWCRHLQEELERLELGSPTERDLDAARTAHGAARAHLADVSRRRDAHQQRVGALGAQVEKLEEAAGRAADAARAAREAEAPAVGAWASLQAAATTAGLLADAYSESARARVEGRTAESLAQLAGNQRVLLLDRLKAARRGDAVRRALEERAIGDTPRWSDQVEDWATVRAWLRERVPPQVSEAEDPVRVLGDLARHLASLRQQLAAREADLRVSARSIANHLNTNIRTARSLVDRLQEGLDGICFGSIERIRVSADVVKPMARVLDVLRSDAVQTTLFDAAPTLEEALARVYEREAGGRIAGDRLLDYREYVELRVTVCRQGGEVSEANAARMSTGEAIGVGAALMMVVLDAWEKRESLGRARARQRSLRFLFLDEASRLSIDVLRTLFELCERLELQMLVAAPEVPLSEGNITWRLERVSGVVHVTGRKVEG